MAGRNWRHAVLFTTLLAAVAACRSSENANVTGVRLATTWRGQDIDQLEFSVTDFQSGGTIVGAQRRPAAASVALSSGASIVILVPDALGGKKVRCDVRGFWAGAQVGSGQILVDLVARSIVEGTVALDVSAASHDHAYGEACTAAADCRSGYCVDGVCCNTGCDAVCLACNVPGRQGTCTHVPAGVTDGGCTAQPASTCALDGTCDGAGGCRKHPAGVRCTPGTCAGSTITDARTCDGKGACGPGPMIECAPFKCEDTGGLARCASTCTTSADCALAEPCENGRCGKSADGAVCTKGEDCRSGFCTDGVCCGTACDGPCVTCGEPGRAGTCTHVRAWVKDPRDICKDSGISSCGQTGACDGGGKCATYPTTATCKRGGCDGTSIRLADAKCDGMGACLPNAPLACSPYACKAGACTGSCLSNADCEPGQTCDVAINSCGKKGTGQDCGAAAECESGFCADGVCCNEGCVGECRSCSLGPTPGTCAFTVVGGDDPRVICKASEATTCGANGKCDGAGQCQKYGAGTRCLPGSCDPDTGKNVLPSTCDGNGNCTAASNPTYCRPYVCNGGKTGCLGSCSSNAQCALPNTCIPGQATCGVLLPSGRACTKKEDCASGHCTEGVCCESDVCGPCLSCKVMGLAGSCQPVPESSTDPSGSCKIDPVGTCDQDGQCDGKGNCRNYPVGTVCAKVACTGDRSTSVNQKTCDRAGVCASRGSVSCDKYKCNSTTGTCYGPPCTVDSECSSGYKCERHNGRMVCR